MRHTIFGQTGLRVSIVSMGGNRLGDPGVDPGAWAPVVERALDLGVLLYDTSNSYNQGRSEKILGRVIGARPEPAVISTKCGVPTMTNDFGKREFSPATIVTGAEESLRRLGRETIDLFMLHSPTVQHLKDGAWVEAMTRLREQGKVRFFGISTDDHASGIQAIEQGAQFLQLEYHLLDPTAEDELLPLAQANNVGIMIRMPLARGLLTGKFAAGQTIPPDQQWRRPTGAQLRRRLERVEQLRFLEREGQTLAQAAIRFVLAHPAVHCAIPGARTVEQLEANVSAADGDLTPEELERVRSLHATWRQGSWLRPAEW